MILLEWGNVHIKTGLLGSSETIPGIDGKQELTTWQNIFLSEHHDPRGKQEIVISCIEV